MPGFDVIVIGGGIAGVSIAYELAVDHRVCLLESESALAFHTTGRSAALYLETFGGPVIRPLTSASRAFFEQPPDGFEPRLLTPRPFLQVAKQGRSGALKNMYDAVSPLVPDVQILTASETEALCPILRPGYAESGLLEPGGMEVDVHALHQGFVHGLRRYGGEIFTRSGVVELSNVDGLWTAFTSAGVSYSAPIVVNAAGSWADIVAGMAGAEPIGLAPLRRTAFMVGAPEGVTPTDLPMLADLDDSFYVKPDGNQFLCSPADETPCEPSDARADELEIARAIDEINEATTLAVRHVRTTWAGLRSFVPDRTPVVGYDPLVEGFFWCAAQGGYGIQTAPALARVGGELVRRLPIPDDVASWGLADDALAVDRPGRSVAVPH